MLYTDDNNNTHLMAGTTQVSQHKKGKIILDLLEQEIEWQWHQLGHMQICTSPQTDNHANTPPQTGCSSCYPTNSIKALLYADELVVIAETEDDRIKTLKQWKDGKDGMDCNRCRKQIRDD